MLRTFCRPPRRIPFTTTCAEISRTSGYVLNNVHNIQPGVPPENIVALFDAAYEYGFYA